MSQTRVVNIRTERCDVYIGRGRTITNRFSENLPTTYGSTAVVFGNPFKVGGYGGSRDAVVELYRQLMLLRLGMLNPRRVPQRVMRARQDDAPAWTPEWWAERIRELDGKALGCWCAPQACHGDVLVELVERLKREGV